MFLHSYMDQVHHKRMEVQGFQILTWGFPFVIFIQSTDRNKDSSKDGLIKG
jgi:hypothetical protein